MRPPTWFHVVEIDPRMRLRDSSHLDCEAKRRGKNVEYSKYMKHMKGRRSTEGDFITRTDERTGLISFRTYINDVKVSETLVIPITEKRPDMYYWLEICEIQSQGGDEVFLEVPRYRLIGPFANSLRAKEFAENRLWEAGWNKYDIHDKFEYTMLDHKWQYILLEREKI